jgi:hypothetical protein
MDDSFFSDLCFKESDKLLLEFIFFLKEGGGENVAQTNVLQHKDVVKPDDIVQHGYRVAQYPPRLISQIKNILNLLDILKHLGLAKPPASLLLERELLLLELAVLDACRPAPRLPSKTGKPISRKGMKVNPHSSLRPSPKPAPKLGRTHKEILELIKGKERTQNLEIFGRFNHITRRTLKRKLSELIAIKTIRRFTENRKVFYSAV